MPVPNSISKFVTEAQWKDLGIEALAPEDQTVIARALEAAFSGAPSPEDLDPEDVTDALKLAKELVEDFKEKMDAAGFSSEDVAAANLSSDRAVEELNDGETE